MFGKLLTGFFNNDIITLSLGDTIVTPILLQLYFASKGSSSNLVKGQWILQRICHPNLKKGSTKSDQGKQIKDGQK
jgi:hypothetical protein